MSLRVLSIMFSLIVIPVSSSYCSDEVLEQNTAHEPQTLRSVEAEQKMLLVLEEFCDRVISASHALMSDSKSPSENVNMQELNQQIFTYSHNLIDAYRATLAHMSPQKQAAMKELMDTIHQGISGYRNQRGNDEANDHETSTDMVLSAIKELCDSCKQQARVILQA